MLQTLLMAEMGPNDVKPFDSLEQAPVILTEQQVSQALASRSKIDDPASVLQQ